MRLMSQTKAVLAGLAIALAATPAARALTNTAASAGSGQSLATALAQGHGDFTPAVRQAYLTKALADARAAGGDASTWDWLARHPALRDGLLSVAYPLPPVYLANLSTLRRELGPAIVDRYPQLTLALAIRPDPIDPTTAGATQRDAPDGADKATAVDPRVAPLVAMLRSTGKSVVDLNDADPSIYAKLGLKPPANDGQKAKLLGEVALASGAYPPRRPQPVASFVKQLVAEYETKLPHFAAGPQWPLFPLADAPWPLLLPLRDTVPANEMAYVWNHFRDDPTATPHDVPMPAGKRIMTYGHYTFDYEKPAVALMASAWNPESLPRIVQDGGVCGRLSALAEFSYISLGRPAMGMYQPGHRALVAYAFTPGVGYTAERLQGITTSIKTTTGWFMPLPIGPRASNEKNPRVGVEYQLGLALAMNVGVDRYVDTRIAVLIARQLPDRVAQATLLRSAADRDPYNVELWYALAKATDASTTLAAVDQLVGHAATPGGDEPELAANTDLGKVKAKPKAKGNAATKDAADIVSVLHESLSGDAAAAAK
jgi:hypothetical protein